MTVRVHIAEALFQYLDVESVLLEVPGGVVHAVFGRDAYDIDDGRIQCTQDFGQTLVRLIAAVKSGILFFGRVAAFVEDEFLLYEGTEVFVDFAAAGTGYAVRGPGTALLRE